MSTENDERRCENCVRERPKSDMFWHKADRAWYCEDVFMCEARLYVICRRGRPEERERLSARRNLSGVSWA